MKKTVFVFFLSILAGVATAQSVVAVAGGSTDMITWTLGEVFTESVLRSNVVRFSQGFNQPFIISATGILNVGADELTFSAWPNPVVDELKISVVGTGIDATWHLYDLQGRLLHSGMLADGHPAIISFSGKAAGEYVLKIENAVGNRSVLVLKK